ncbi:MAG TPA: TRAP transporter large permease [Candidatus Dorea intestinavium]|nr:TRAP transporter large permease [Candidatus Dorea intestinavium]
MPSEKIAILLLIGIFISLMAVRMPIALSIGISSIITCWYLKIPMQMVLQSMVKGVNTYSLLAVPFFILMGEIMSAGGISKRLLQLASVMVGWMHGGLAMVDIIASLLFGAVSGSSAASVATIGPTMIPTMEKEGYDKTFATNITMASSVEGILIPPSQNMVIYSLAAGGVSVGALFLAGIFPGCLLALCLMVYSYIVARKRNYPVGEKFSLKKFFLALKDAFWGLMTIVIVVIGVCTGFITATEGAGLAVLWSIFVTFAIYREVPIRELPKMLLSAVKTLAMIMILISTSTAFGWLMAYLKVPKHITNGIYSITKNPVVIMLIINLLLLILGMVMEMGSLILIITPILLPIVTSMGYSPIHFGVIMILNLGIGLLTPPVGSSLFIGSAVSGIKIEKLAKGMVPIYITMIICLMLVTFIPAISMTLPNLQ